MHGGLSASEYPLPLISFREKQPAFHVTELSEADGCVRQRFSKPFVYYAGAASGCGCEFAYDEVDGDDCAGRKETVRRLAEYLERAVEYGDVEVYSCWSGDESLESDSRRRVAADHFGGASFRFNELELLTVSKR